MKSGLTLGYLQSYNIVEGLPVFVEYGANIQYIFGKASTSLFDEEDSDAYTKARTFAVNVPVNASLRLSFNNDEIAVTPFVGLNFRYNLLGKTIEGVGDTKHKTNLFEADEEDGAFKRFQAGLNYGVSVSYDVYTLSLGRVSDFTNFVDDGEGRFVITTISLGYAF